MRRRLKAPETPLWTLERDGVTQGMLANMPCTRKMELAYRVGLTTPKFKGAIKFGEVFHEALDYYYTALSEGADWEWAMTRGDKAIADNEKKTKAELEEIGTFDSVQEDLEELYGAVEALFKAYCGRWKSDDIGGIYWERLEEVFRIPITVDGVTFDLRGKIDGRYRNKDRGLMKLETKTKGDINERNIMAILGYDIQVMFYFYALRRITGEVPAGVLYNVARRPGLRRKKGETIKQFVDRIKEDIEARTDFYFVRFEASFYRKDLDDWEKNEFIPMLRRFLEWGKNGVHYRFSPACETKYGTCEFLDYCSCNDRSGLVKKTTPFPELVVLK